MKKQLLNLSFVAVALALYVTAIAKPVAPVRTLEVPSIATPAMDGVAETGYSAVQSTSVFNSAGLTGGDADFKSEFQVAYNSSYFFILAKISDDVEHNYNWGVGNSWEFDNIEFFFQLDTNTVTTSYGSNTVQLRVDRGLDSVETAGRAPRKDYKYYMEAQAAGGWITEVAIPWTAVYSAGDTPEDIHEYAGQVIGFDFSGADSDNSDGDAAVGNRDVQAAWDEDGLDKTEDLAWNNTSVFGYVTLAATIVEGVEANTAVKINAYPNPATESITFDIEGMETVEIYTVTGSQVMVVETRGTVDVSALKSGLYIAKIDDTSVKFIVE